MVPRWWPLRGADTQRTQPLLETCRTTCTCAVPCHSPVTPRADRQRYSTEVVVALDKAEEKKQNHADSARASGQAKRLDAQAGYCLHAARHHALKFSVHCQWVLLRRHLGGVGRDGVQVVENMATAGGAPVRSSRLAHLLCQPPSLVCSKRKPGVVIGHVVAHGGGR